MVNIDTVYQKVLAIANKEQRGYITPQEFNLFADHAQKDIFDQYFYDLNQFRRVPGNDTEYADMVKILEEKISLFEVYGDAVSDNGFGIVDLNTGIPNLYRLGDVRVVYSGRSFTTAEEIQIKDLDIYGSGGLTGFTTERPRYTRYIKNGSSKLHLYPNSGSGNDDFIISNVIISYVKKPDNINWGYNVINDNALYDPNTSLDFELHPSEENNLIIKILALAGIAIKDPAMYQIAVAEDNKNIQQEKS